MDNPSIGPFCTIIAPIENREGGVPVLRAEGIGKTYTHGETPVVALREVDLSLEKGEFVALTGPSGCGKSTLLHLCGGMDYPTRGRIWLDGADLGSLDEVRLTRIRRRQIGFVFQSFNLLPTLTAVENTALPLMLDGVAPEMAKRKATGLLERVGLGHRLGHYPQQLSGGEMQRVGIARAVCHAPLLVLADEPTGNLDSANGADVLELLRDLNRSLGVTVLLATHSAEMAAASQRVLHMVDGRIESGRRGSGLDPTDGAG